MGIISTKILVDSTMVFFFFTSRVKTKTSGSYYIDYNYSIPLPAQEVRVYLKDTTQELPRGFNSKDGKTEVEYQLDSKYVTNSLTDIVIELQINAKYLSEGLGSLIWIHGFTSIEGLQINNNSLFYSGVPASKDNNSITFPKLNLQVKDTKKRSEPKNRPISIEVGESLQLTVFEKLNIVLEKANLNSLDVEMKAPRSSSYQQVTYKVHPDGSTKFLDEHGNVWFRWKYTNLAVGSKIDFAITTTLTRLPVLFYENNYGSLRDYRSVEEYLHPTVRWNLHETDLSDLISISTDDVYLIILKIFQFVNNFLDYRITKGREDAYSILTTGSGDCSEFSDLMVALLRKFGIPSRLATGLAIDRKNYTLDGHAWVEFMVPNGRWFAVDPTWGSLGGIDSAHILDGYDEGIDSKYTDLDFSYSYSARSNEPKPELIIEKENFITKIES